MALDEPHDRLVVTGHQRGRGRPRPLPGGGCGGGPWEEAVGATGADRSDDGLLARLCRLDSPLVARHPDLRALAAGPFTPGGRWARPPPP